MTNRTLSRSLIRSALSCIICETPGTVQPIELDHIYERSTHPHLKDEPLNLAPLCSGPDSCHTEKSNKKLWTWLEPEGYLKTAPETIEGVALYYCWSVESKHDPDAQRIEVGLNQRYKCLERIGETNDGQAVRATAEYGEGGDLASGLRGQGEDGEPRRSEQSDRELSGDGAERFALKESHVEWGELTFNDWREAYGQIASVSRNNPWWLGDAWVEAEDKWPDSLYQSGEELAREAGKSPETISNYANVCRAFAPSSRHRGLSLSHHSVVYTLPPDEREAWLAKAEAEHLTERELKALVRPKQEQVRCCSECGHQGPLADFPVVK